jgi:hypothetical protein
MPAFAHTATSSGPNTEILLLGAGMIVLAGVFFFQKTASRRASLVLAVLGVVAITGAFTVAKKSSGGDHHDDVAIAIVSPEDGGTVEAGTVPIEVDLTGAELASESTSEDAGHLHVYVDGSEPDMLSSSTVEVELEPGEHEVEVEYVGADHAALDPPVTDAVTITAE